MRRRRIKEYGFTLVELLVAMAVFTTLITVAVAIFIQGFRGEQNLTNLIAVNNNAAFLIEQLAREVRTGFDFFEGAESCAGATGFFTSMQFTNAGQKTIIYSRADSRMQRSADGLVHFLTAENVSVERLCFAIAPSPRDAECDPRRITMLVTVKPKNGTDDQILNLQTTVSSRVLPRDVHPETCRTS